MTELSIKRLNAHEFKRGDKVLHKPSGETWILSRVDNLHVYPAGWPPTAALVKNCEMVEPGAGLAFLAKAEQDRAANKPDSTIYPTYQERVDAWMDACFPVGVKDDVTERSHRFLEEALELVQANGYTKEDAHKLVDYVFNRPAGLQEQEVGGVMVTLAAMCNALDTSLDDAAEKELERNWKNTEAIRRKWETKPNKSPLPQEVENE